MQRKYKIIGKNNSGLKTISKYIFNDYFQNIILAKLLTDSLL